MGVGNGDYDYDYGCDYDYDCEEGEVGFPHAKTTESRWGCGARDLLGCLASGQRRTSGSPFYGSCSNRAGVVEA